MRCCPWSRRPATRSGSGFEGLHLTGSAPPGPAMGPAPAAGGRPARPRGPARPGPQPLRTTRERGRAGTPGGRRLGHPTDARDARVLERADRDRLAVPQPAARSRRAARRRAPGRQRQKLRRAPRPSRPPPPLPCGSRAASPPPPPSPARRCPRPSGPRIGLPPLGRGRRRRRRAAAPGGGGASRLPGSLAGWPADLGRGRRRPPPAHLHLLSAGNGPPAGEVWGVCGRSHSLQNYEPGEESPPHPLN